MESVDIREWRGHDVLDENGKKIGSLESVYVDTATDLPFFATVTIGLPTKRRLAFVPLTGGLVGPGYVRVAFPKSLVKGAPAIETDGVLAAEQEPDVFGHYRLDYAPGAGGERRLARR